jgi:hypothetical protein
MNMSFDVHVKSKDVVTVGEIRGTGAIYLQTEDEDGKSFSLYFPDTSRCRAWLAKNLNELRRVERGDDAYHYISSSEDHVAVPRTVTLNGKEVEVVS